MMSQLINPVIKISKFANAHERKHKAYSCNLLRACEPYVLLNPRANLHSGLLTWLDTPTSFLTIRLDLLLTHSQVLCFLKYIYLHELLVCML